MKPTKYIITGHVYQLLCVCLISLLACNDDGPTIKNPFKSQKDTTPITRDTYDYKTIQGLHAGLFKPTCANSGCHDGNFEPDFRTVESSYYSLVQQPAIKNKSTGGFQNRVVPFSSDLSMLPYRMTIDLNGNSGIMPLALEPNSNYPREKDVWVNRINDWINAGAKDWMGRTPIKVDFPPQILGLQFLVNNQALVRPGQYEAAEISVGQSPEIWISLSDDNADIASLKNVSINASTDPGNFDVVNEKSMKAGPSKNLQGLFSANCEYYWNAKYDGSNNKESDVVWFRVTVSDPANTNYQIPNYNSMFLLKTYFALKFK